jgi:hypothetical protein
MVLLSPALSQAEPHLRDLEVKQNSDVLLVSVRLELDEDLARELKGGVDKKLIFYVDLFRAWYKWPDEFVLGKRVERELKCDNVKGEYVVTELTRKGPVATRFASCDELLAYALKITDVRLVDAREVEHGRYIVKVTAESHLRNIPPFITVLIPFAKDKEFEVRIKSQVMKIGGIR